MSQTTLSFRDAENRRRRGQVQKGKQEESFLDSLNELLQSDPLGLYQRPSLEFPTVFILGLPRSGTTLLYQVLAAGLDVGFVDCLAARFWEAPVYGMMLSKAASRGTPSFTFQSEYARPASLFDPHEFSYFWQKWLRKEAADPESGKQLSDPGSVDWEGLRSELGQMQQLAGKPMIFKGLAAIGNLVDLAAHIPRTIFVYLERDIEEVAASLLLAREFYYGTQEEWWSLYPPQYEALKELDPPQQVVGQAVYLRKQFQDELNALSGPPVISVAYKDLCLDPQQVCQTVVNQAEESYGIKISLSGYEFPRFKPRTSQVDLTVQAQIRRAFEHFANDVPCLELRADPVPRVEVHFSSEIADRVRELTAQAVLATGQRVCALELALAEMFPGLHFACVSSGLGALHLALSLFEDKYTNVSLPSFVCEAALLAAQYTRLEPDILDVDPDTFNLPPQDSSQKEILVAPHTFGLPAPVARYRACIVIEDVAQALGASVDGRPCGYLSDVAVLSFYATKLAGGGYGGAVASRDVNLIEEVRDLRQYNHRTTYKRRFQYPMSDLSAEITIGRLQHLDEDLSRREEIVSLYRESLQGYPLEPQAAAAPGCRRVWFSYALRTPAASEIIRLAQERDIGIAPVLSRGLHDCLGLKSEEFPHTVALINETISLPIYEGLTLAQIRRVTQTVIEALERENG